MSITEAVPRTRAGHRSVRGLGGMAKRALDVTLSALGLLLLSPLFAAIALILRITDGAPVLYRQTRVGLDGHHFSIVKFRTMKRDAEEGLGPIWSVPNDPRCSRFGALLRRTGMDEIPQLWNIVKGEMSIVGPRPERPEFVRQLGAEHTDYELRHDVRSGLTGYSQVHGWRGYTDPGQRLRHDLHYVRRWSLTLDFYILLLTLVRGWSERTRNGVVD